MENRREDQKQIPLGEENPNSENWQVKLEGVVRYILTFKWLSDLFKKRAERKPHEEQVGGDRVFVVKAKTKMTPDPVMPAPQAGVAKPVASASASSIREEGFGPRVALSQTPVETSPEEAVRQLKKVPVTARDRRHWTSYGVKPFKRPAKFETRVTVRGGIPNILVSETAYEKMMLFEDRAPQEVGWLGSAVKLDDGNYLIEDCFLLRQRVSGTVTLITDRGLAEFSTKLIQREDGVELWNKIQFWGHSHASMEVRPSGQDDRQMDLFAKSGHEWFIRGICNDKGDLKFDLFLFNPATEEVMVVFENVPWEKVEEIDQDRVNQIQQEYASLVTESGSSWGNKGAMTDDPEGYKVVKPVQEPDPKAKATRPKPATTPEVAVRQEGGAEVKAQKPDPDTIDIVPGGDATPLVSDATDDEITVGADTPAEISQKPVQQDLPTPPSVPEEGEKLAEVTTQPAQKGKEGADE